MCEVPVLLVDNNGDVTGHDNIEIRDFDEKKHHLKGRVVEVLIRKSTFEDFDMLTKVQLSGLFHHVDKPLLAVDPGSKVPVYRVEVRVAGPAVSHSYYWVRKEFCAP